jgi:hypothetical protein
VDTGQQIWASPNGDYQQVKGADGQPTGDRLDRGGHANSDDPAAQGPHAHVPGLTTPDGNPHRSGERTVMKPKFTYDNIVCARSGADISLRPGERAWVVAVEEERRGAYYEKFPPGVVYTIEFNDGSSIEVHEDDLELVRAEK